LAGGVKREGKMMTVNRSSISQETTRSIVQRHGVREPPGLDVSPGLVRFPQRASHRTVGLVGRGVAGRGDPRDLTLPEIERAADGYDVARGGGQRSNEMIGIEHHVVIEEIRNFYKGAIDAAAVDIVDL
jgi:hypothetical protein